MTPDAFLPANQGQMLISVTNASAVTVIPASWPTVRAGGPAMQGGEYLELSNAGTLDVFIETSPGGNQAATVPIAGTPGSYRIAPGQVKVIRRAPGDTHIAAISTAAGPTALWVAVGNGI